MRWVTATVCALLALGAGLPGLAQAKTRFTLIGHGFGHGVGMSQYGALGDAEHGWKFDRILAHYYQGTTLGAAPSPQTSERVLLTAGRTSINVSAASPIQFVDEGGATNVTLPSGHYGVRPGTNPGRIQVVDLECYREGTYLNVLRQHELLRLDERRLLVQQRDDPQRRRAGIVCWRGGQHQ